MDINKIFTYYEKCWDERFLNGHNKKSNACHYGFYDLSNENINNEINDTQKSNTNNFLIDLINIDKFKNITILDAGCGYGGTVEHLAKYFVNSTVHGITLTDTQISCSRNLLKKGNINNAKIFYGNFNTTNFSMDFSLKYDIIFFIESICHANSKKETIENALKMLKKGGKIIIFDYFENCQYLEDKLIHKETIKKGWAIPSFINLDVFKKISGISINSYNKTSNVLPGMYFSEQKAFHLLNSKSHSKDLTNHLLGCILLYQLSRDNILNYNVVIINKI